MSTWNPTPYTGHRAKTPDSDAFFPMKPDGSTEYGAQAYWDLVRMKYEYEANEAWYNSYESYQAKYNQMRGIGISPSAAAGSLVSNGANATQGADAGQSGMIDTMANTIAGLNGISSNLNQAQSNAIQKEAVDAQVNNLRSQDANLAADTANKISQNPTIAPLAESEVVKNTADAAKAHSDVKVNEADIKRIEKVTGLTEEDIKLRQQENFWYSHVKARECQEYEARILAYISEAELNWERVNTEISQQSENYASARNLDAQALLAGEQMNTEKAKQANLNSDTAVNRMNVNGMTYDNKIKAWYAKGIAETGVPYSASDQERIAYYIAKRDFAAARKAATAPWIYQMYVTNGSVTGEDIVLPSDIYDNEEDYGINRTNGNYGNIMKAGRVIRGFLPQGLPFGMPRSISNPTYNNHYYNYRPKK